MVKEKYVREYLERENSDTFNELAEVALSERRDEANSPLIPLLRVILAPFLWCRRFARFLYDWTLSLAHTRYGVIGLAVLSFAESSFFPIPPDALQIALSIERPKRSFYYAFVSAIASTFGAALGWFIGASLWNVVGGYFVPAIISNEAMEQVAVFFDRFGFTALFAAAFTPIPFKAFTISSGIAQMALPVMLFASLIGRSARFFLVGALIYAFGARIKDWIDKYFGWLTLAFTAAIIGGILCVKYLL